MTLVHRQRRSSALVPAHRRTDRTIVSIRRGGDATGASARRRRHRRLAELALSGGADADEAASGQLHIIISFFVWTRRAGAGRRRYR